MEGSGSSSFRNTERVEYYLNDVSEGIIFTVAIVVFVCSKEGAILQECDDILSDAGASTTSAEYRLCGIKWGRILSLKIQDLMKQGLKEVEVCCRGVSKRSDKYSEPKLQIVSLPIILISRVSVQEKR